MMFQSKWIAIRQAVYTIVIIFHFMGNIYMTMIGLQDKVINPCSSLEKDRVLSIDRKQTPQNKILLIGYVTGAARQRDGMTQSKSYKRAGSMISGSLTYAINMINSLGEKFNKSQREMLNLPEPPLPEGYKLDFCYFETFGNESESIRAVTTLVERVEVSAIIGPQETCHVEAAIAATYNIPMLSHYCDDASLRGKLFGRPRPVFIRTRPQPYDIAAAVISLLKHYNWLKVAYLTTEDPEYTFTAEIIRTRLIRQGIRLLYTNSFPYPQIYGLSSNHFRTIIEESHRIARIYLVIGEGYDSVSLLETLKDYGLLENGNYFVVGIDKRTYDPSAIHIWSHSEFGNLKQALMPNMDSSNADESNNDNGRTTTNHASCIQIDPVCYKSYMQITHTAPMTQKRHSLQEYNHCYLSKPPFNFHISSPNFNLEPEAGYLVDAVWLYALAAGEILKNGGTINDVRNGDKISEKLIHRRYVSSLGYINEINERGDAQGNYTVVMGVDYNDQLNVDQSSTATATTTTSRANNKINYRDPKWYDLYTPLLPNNCRRVLLHRNVTQKPQSGRNYNSRKFQQKPRVVFKPIGMFYPLDNDNIHDNTDKTVDDTDDGDDVSDDGGFTSIVNNNRRQANNNNKRTKKQSQQYKQKLRTKRTTANRNVPFLANINEHDILVNSPLLNNFTGQEQKYRFSLLPGIRLTWIGDGPPVDEPKCGFDDSECKKESYRIFIICIGSVSAILLVISIGAIFIYRNHKFEQELERLLWKIDYRDIVLKKTSTYKPPLLHNSQFKSVSDENIFSKYWTSYNKDHQNQHINQRKNLTTTIAALSSVTTTITTTTTSISKAIPTTTTAVSRKLFANNNPLRLDEVSVFDDSSIEPASSLTQSPNPTHLGDDRYCRHHYSKQQQHSTPLQIPSQPSPSSLSKLLKKNLESQSPFDVNIECVAGDKLSNDEPTMINNTTTVLDHSVLKEEADDSLHSLPRHAQEDLKCYTPALVRREKRSSYSIPTTQTLLANSSSVDPQTHNHRHRTFQPYDKLTERNYSLPNILETTTVAKTTEETTVGLTTMTTDQMGQVSINNSTNILHNNKTDGLIQPKKKLSFCEKSIKMTEHNVSQPSHFSCKFIRHTSPSVTSTNGNSLSNKLMEAQQLLSYRNNYNNGNQQQQQQQPFSRSEQLSFNELRDWSTSSAWSTNTTLIGHWKRQQVAIHRINLPTPCLNREVKKALKILRDTSHKNLCIFIGACVEVNLVCVLWEYVNRGSLRDILTTDMLPRLKPMFIASLVFDLIHGLTYLHESDLKYHGNLKITNCVVDSRWFLKLTDFGLNAFREGESFAHLNSDAYYSSLYWTPPELLRRKLALVMNGKLSTCHYPQLIDLARLLLLQGIIFCLENDNGNSNNQLTKLSNSIHHHNNTLPYLKSADRCRVIHFLKRTNRTRKMKLQSPQTKILRNTFKRMYLGDLKPVEVMESKLSGNSDFVNLESGKISLPDELIGAGHVKHLSTDSGELPDPENVRKGFSDPTNVVSDLHSNEIEPHNQVQTGQTNMYQTRKHKLSNKHLSEQLFNFDPYSSSQPNRANHQRKSIFNQYSPQSTDKSFNYESTNLWQFKTKFDSQLSTSEFYVKSIHLPLVRDHVRAMQSADMYAFAMILFELHHQKQLFKDIGHSPQEIIRRAVVLNDQFRTPYRPKLSLLSCEEKYVTDCIEACWAENPSDRPTIKQAASRLKCMQGDRPQNIMDHVMSLMQDYAQDLEKIVSARTTELSEEKRRTEQLLNQMLPIPVAEQLKRGKAVEPEAFDMVTIYFSDICGFTEWSSSASPFEVVNLLNDLYTRFDNVLSYYDVYKVETVGDAYMVVSGLSNDNDKHAGEVASMSLRVLQEIRYSFPLALRIGIHSGPCAAGVVGTRMPRYCLFGDTVNTASRMESSGEPWKIHCSENCKQELDRLGGYILEERGLIALKGKGIVRTYWLLHKTRPSNHRDKCTANIEDNALMWHSPNKSGQTDRSCERDLTSVSGSPQHKTSTETTDLISNTDCVNLLSANQTENKCLVTKLRRFTHYNSKLFRLFNRTSMKRKYVQSTNSKTNLLTPTTNSMLTRERKIKQQQQQQDQNQQYNNNSTENTNSNDHMTMEIKSSVKNLTNTNQTPQNMIMMSEDEQSNLICFEDVS